MSSQITSDNFYYTTNTLSNESKDEYASIDVDTSRITSNASRSRRNESSNNTLTKRWGGRTNVLILVLVFCNILLTVVSLILAVLALHLSLGQVEEHQGLSDAVSVVEEQIQHCNLTTAVEVVNLRMCSCNEGNHESVYSVENFKFLCSFFTAYLINFFL